MHAGTLIGRAEHSVLLGSVRTELSSTGEYCAKNTDMFSNNTGTGLYNALQVLL